MSRILAMFLCFVTVTAPLLAGSPRNPNDPNSVPVTPFTMPPATHFTTSPTTPGTAPGLIAVNIPESDGVVFIDDQLIPSSGKLRYLQSPPLAPGQAYPLHLRAAYVVGDHVLVQEKQVVIRAGETANANFDGKNTISVPVPEPLPAPVPIPGPACHSPCLYTPSYYPHSYCYDLAKYGPYAPSYGAWAHLNWGP
jgi:uncharacterized protein (TIGR03000 family)